MAEFRAFPVRLLTGVRYWTVIDERYTVVAPVDEFLLHVRLGRDRAESTTQAYATGLALYFTWCAASRLDWSAAHAPPGQVHALVGVLQQGRGRDACSRP